MKKQILLEHKNAELILEEGWRLFQQKGYRGVSIDEVCRNCGLSKPTLYYYFKNKEELFVQVLQYQLHGFRSAAERTGSLNERLEHVAEAILTSFQSEYSSVLHDREHIKNPANLNKVRDAFHQELFEPLINLMLLGIDAGELKKENPETLTLIYLGIINNFIGKSRGMKIDNISLAHQLTQFFFEGAKIR
jgi:TetR/AcrR family transcriptional regulator